MKALVPLADGVEEMEAVIVIDTLRRAQWEVTSAAIGDQTVEASRGIRLVADARWNDIDPSAYDTMVLPGGAEGARRLASHAGVLETVRVFAATGRTVAAICAAPLVLQAAGILEGREATCHPSVRADLTAASAGNGRVIVDGNVITSQGPGTAFEFALTLIRRLDNPRKAADVAEAMLVGWPDPTRRGGNP
jgi:4-methyl-5(b-hydroxyethyl)-thiazole monophosphate biosynthesis